MNVNAIISTTKANLELDIVFEALEDADFVVAETANDVGERKSTPNIVPGLSKTDKPFETADGGQAHVVKF